MKIGSFLILISYLPSTRKLINLQIWVTSGCALTSYNYKSHLLSGLVQLGPFGRKSPSPTNRCINQELPYDMATWSPAASPLQRVMSATKSDRSDSVKVGCFSGRTCQVRFYDGGMSFCWHFLITGQCEPIGRKERILFGSVGSTTSLSQCTERSNVSLAALTSRSSTFKEVLLQTWKESKPRVKLSGSNWEAILNFWPWDSTKSGKLSYQLNSVSSSL